VLQMKILLTLCFATVTYFPGIALSATGNELLNEAMAQEKNLGAQGSVGNTGARTKVIELYSGALDSGQLSEKDRNNALVSRARLYAQDGKCSLAIRDLDETIGAGNKGARAYALRALCYGQVGSLEAARKDFDRAIAINTRDPILFRERANILTAQKNYESAERDISASMKALKPAESADLYVMRGDLAFAQDKYERAIADYMQAIRVTKKDVSQLKVSGSVIYLAPIFEKLGNAYHALSRANAQGK
jgi:tetratricopeptide (TPR) repeat protein